MPVPLSVLLSSRSRSLTLPPADSPLALAVIEDVTPRRRRRAQRIAGGWALAFALFWLLLAVAQA